MAVDISTELGQLDAVTNTLLTKLYRNPTKNMNNDQVNQFGSLVSALADLADFATAHAPEGSYAEFSPPSYQW